MVGMPQDVKPETGAVMKSSHVCKFCKKSHPTSMWYVYGKGLQTEVPKEIERTKRSGLTGLLFGRYEEDDYCFQISGRDLCNTVYV